MTSERTDGLSIHGLDVLLGGRAVLSSIDLDVGPDEYHVILGPSGSGKTTLLRAIAGLEPVAAGKIRLAGTPLSSVGFSLSPDRRGVGMLFQSLALWPQWNVMQQIEVVLAQRVPSRQERARRAAELFELVGLSHLTTRAVHELSGGEAQRLALARALASDPKILLLDEPLGSVDASLRSELAAGLRQVQRRVRIPVVHVTHDQAEGLGVADRVTVLRGGRAEQSDSIDGIVRRPQTEFVAEFVGKHAVLDGEAIDGSVSTALGALACVGGHRGRVRVAIRPGQVVLGSGGIDALVTHLTYLPGGWLHRLDVSGISLHALSAEARPTGSHVAVHITGEPWVFPKNP